MNRSIVWVAILSCASCAHTSSRPKAEIEALAADILLGDSAHATCARDEVSYCKVTTRATQTSGLQARERCECVPTNLFETHPSGNR
jgi:hypothetical protein